MNKCPCCECLVFARCKISIKNKGQEGIINFAVKEDCPILIKFLEYADQDEVNSCRILYGLEAIK
jgi:hypothetical protein